MKSKLLLLILSLFVIAGCSSNENISGTVPAGTPTSTLCSDAGGLWIDSANECEGISPEYCQEIGGQFETCGSACRNDPNAEVCTKQCVQYCSFE